MSILLSVRPSVCMSARYTAATTNDDSFKSAEPRAPLAEMEDIEMKSKKNKEKTAEVQCSLLFTYLLYGQ